MSEIICDSCGNEGDFASRIICEACLNTATKRSACCIKNKADNKKLRAENTQIKGLIRMALDELGVPSKDYPAPIANAVDFLNEALKAQ